MSDFNFTDDVPSSTSDKKESCEAPSFLKKHMQWIIILVIGILVIVILYMFYRRYQNKKDTQSEKKRKSSLSRFEELGSPQHYTPRVQKNVHPEGSFKKPNVQFKPSMNENFQGMPHQNQPHYGQFTIPSHTMQAHTPSSERMHANYPPVGMPNNAQ